LRTLRVSRRTLLAGRPQLLRAGGAAANELRGAPLGRARRRVRGGAGRGTRDAPLIDQMKHHRQPQDTARMLMTRVPAMAAADDTLIDAAARMAERNVRHLPVVDGDQHVVGIISDRDVRTLMGDSSRSLRPSDALVRMQTLRVADAMTRDAFVVKQDAPFADVARVFVDQRVGAVPVVDDADRLVGIISYVDVFRNAGAL
jgi:CBS domain-containing protein